MSAHSPPAPFSYAPQGWIKRGRPWHAAPAPSYSCKDRGPPPYFCRETGHLTQWHNRWGAQGGRMPPGDFWLGNFWWPTGNKRGKEKREKGWKLRKKEGKLYKGRWKFRKWWEDPFFFFCSSLFEPTKICCESTKMEIFYREKAFYSGKKIRKNDFAPSENCYAPGLTVCGSPGATTFLLKKCSYPIEEYNKYQTWSFLHHEGIYWNIKTWLFRLSINRLTVASLSLSKSGLMKNRTPSAAPGKVTPRINRMKITTYGKVAVK